MNRRARRRTGKVRNSGAPKRFGFTNFLLGSPNSYLANWIYINGLAIFGANDFPRSSKFLFAGFLRNQCLAVGKFGKLKIQIRDP
jgi:hypothetical protein